MRFNFSNRHKEIAYFLFVFDTLPETGPLVLQWHSHREAVTFSVQYSQYNLIIEHKYRCEIEEVEVV